MKLRSLLPALAALAMAVTLAACDVTDVDTSESLATHGASAQGVTPRVVAGGLAVEAAQVCTDVLINPDGEPWLGVAVDPAAAGHFAGFTVNLAPRNRTLGWSTPTNGTALMQAVVVEGGGAAAVYAYDQLPDNPGARAFSDAGLHAPATPGSRAFPPITRYVLCYAEGAGDGTSGQGVTPDFVEGNISGDAAAVCANADVNPDGEPWLGVKVDPDASGTYGGFDVTIDPSGRYLDWAAVAGNVMEAVVMKGGPNTYVYSYNPPLLSADTGLHAPDNGGGNVPEISHFVICYTEGASFQGCSQGYWKNHPDAWGGTGFSADQALSSVFAGLDPAIEGASLLAALSFQGGPDLLGAQRNLMRQAVAALLNAAHPDVDFPRTATEVVDDVNDALASGDRPTILALASALDAENNLGCPLN